MSLNTLVRKTTNAGLDLARVVFLGAVVPVTVVALLTLIA